MLQHVSLWGQMSVKSVTADHADPSHNHGRADPVATLSLGNLPVVPMGGWQEQADTATYKTCVWKYTSVRAAAPHISHCGEARTAARLQVPLRGRVTHTPHEDESKSLWQLVWALHKFTRAWKQTSCFLVFFPASWMLWFLIDSPCPFGSVPYHVVLGCSNVPATDRRAQIAVVPTKEHGYNPPGRKSESVLIRMIGSLHLVWKIYCCQTKKKHILLSIKSFLFYSNASSKLFHVLCLDV